MIKGREQDPHQVGQVPSLAGVQARQQGPLAAQQPGQRRVHPVLSLVGEGDQDAGERRQLADLMRILLAPFDAAE